MSFVGIVPEGCYIGHCRYHDCIAKIKQDRVSKCGLSKTGKYDGEHVDIVDDHRTDQYGTFGPIWNMSHPEKQQCRSHAYENYGDTDKRQVNFLYGKIDL